MRGSVRAQRNQGLISLETSCKPDSVQLPEKFRSPQKIRLFNKHYLILQKTHSPHPHGAPQPKSNCCKSKPACSVETSEEVHSVEY